MFSISTAFAAKSRNELVQDSQRRQVLQKSAQSWFERNVLPSLGGTLDSISSYGVSVKERGVALPPDLGGPREMVQVTLEAQFSGWMDRGYRSGYSNRHYGRRYDNRHGRWRGFPDYGDAGYGGTVNCYFSQKLWASIDGRGRPLKIRNGQRPVYIVACRSI